MIPQVLKGIYAIGEVTPDSLRTGGRFGQSRDDVVGQRAPITRLADNLKIYDYPNNGTGTGGQEASWVPWMDKDLRTILHERTKLPPEEAVGVAQQIPLC